MWANLLLLLLALVLFDYFQSKHQLIIALAHAHAPCMNDQFSQMAHTACLRHKLSHTKDQSIHCLQSITKMCIGTKPPQSPASLISFIIQFNF